MNRKMLRDDQWARIEHILPGKAGDPGCTARDNRVFVEAVLWILRTGSPWQDLPHELRQLAQHVRSLCPLARQRRLGARG